MVALRKPGCGVACSAELDGEDDWARSVHCLSEDPNSKGRGKGGKTTAVAVAKAAKHERAEAWEGRAQTRWSHLQM